LRSSEGSASTQSCAELGSIGTRYFNSFSHSASVASSFRFAFRISRITVHRTPAFYSTAGATDTVMQRILALATQGVEEEESREVADKMKQRFLNDLGLQKRLHDLRLLFAEAREEWCLQDSEWRKSCEAALPHSHSLKLVHLTFKW
jgi:hypothetical protein